MKRISKTSDPQGTAVGLIGAGAVALTGAVCPPLGIFLGIISFFTTKAISKHFVDEEIDQATLSDCTEEAQDFFIGTGNRGIVKSTATIWSDAMIPLPRTRIHTFLPDTETDEPASFPTLDDGYESTMDLIERSLQRSKPKPPAWSPPFKWKDTED